MLIMKNLLQLEEAAMFGLSIYVFSQLGFAWWWYPVLILAPDISMIGYAVNTKMGAACYNLIHHKGLAIAVYITGVYLQNDLLLLAGVILFGHSSMDRIMGYGLKYNDSFQHTHLGMIGKKAHR
jgi:hypothetical protein